MVEIVLAIGMLFLAGLIRGFSGFGFAIAAVPLLSLLRPPAEIVAVVLILQLCISLQGVRGAWAVADRPSLARLALGVAIATPLGLWGLSVLPAGPTRLVIAVLVGATVLVLGGGFRLPATPRGLAVVGVGLVSGLCNGLAAMPGPPVIAFYLASPLRAEAGRGAMIVLFLFTSVAGLLPLTLLGHVGRQDWLLAALGLPGVWAGSSLGAWMYRRSPEAQYRRVALWMLGATGVAAAARVVLGEGVVAVDGLNPPDGPAGGTGGFEAPSPPGLQPRGRSGRWCRMGSQAAATWSGLRSARIARWAA